MRIVHLGNCVLVTCWVGLLTTCALSQEAEKRSPDATDAQAAVASSFCQCIDNVADSLTKAQIEKALRDPLRSNGLDFSGQPLQDVMTFLSDEYKIPIQIDLQALTEAGIQPDEPITVQLRNISLQSALRLLLRSHHLTYTVRDEVLNITTVEAANNARSICVYDVRDLVKPGDEVALTRLVDAIMAVVANDSWSQNGGGGAEIRALQPGILVVSQADEPHRQIRALLGAVRRINNGDSTPGAMLGRQSSRYFGDASPAAGTSSWTAQGEDLVPASPGMSADKVNPLGPSTENPFGEIQQTQPPLSRSVGQ